ncbi:sensor histidine kinase [Acetobacter indonesiensis]
MMRMPLAWLECRSLRIKSVSLRFALIYGALFVGSGFLFLSFVWWGTVGLLERRTENAITTDAQILAQTFTESGRPALVALINERLEQDIDDNALYLLVTPNNEWVAGNLAEWPVKIHGHYWFSLPVQRADMLNTARVRAYTLPDGYKLLVGRDLNGRTQLAHMLTEMLLWTCIMMLVLAVSGGWFIRRLFRNIIHSIGRTTQAITHGDMTRRIPIKGTDKELDEVAFTINEMLDRIVRLMDGVRQVSNSMAHDLRTPITRARAQLEEASLTAKSEDELRRAIDKAVINLDNVTSICEAILRIAQIEAGARRSAFSEFDLVSALETVVELYEAVAEEHQVNFVCQMPEKLPFFGDCILYQQAVANLLDNAIKFSPPQSTIRLTVEVTPAPSDTAPALVHLTLADQGPGMNDADMARATERFFRAEQARNTPGSGLGLSLVQAIIQLHGGTLRLASNAPGLVVKIETPLYPHDI